MSDLPLSRRRVLVVDDQPSLRGLLEVALTEAGAMVWSAENGKAALSLLEVAQPELILLDLFMPVLDGWGVLDAMRGGAFAAVPVVLETAAEDFESFKRAKSAGVAAFISKPFRLEEVLEICRRILAGARPLQGRAHQEKLGSTVRVEDEQGAQLASGEVIDLASHGAQIALDCLLSLGMRVQVVLEQNGTRVVRRGEVRWASRVEDRFHHGLSLRGDSTPAD